MVPIATAPALRCGVVPPACRARSASGSAAALPAACRLSQPLRRGAGSVAAHVFTSPLAESSIQPYPDPFPGMQPGDDLPEDYGHVGPSPPKHRRAGVVLHPTSLPGKYGMGEIGAEAFAFVDWLAATGMQLWQLLPLVPPETTYWSPYSGLDALCGNTLLLPIDELLAMGLLAAGEVPEEQPVELNADFPAVAEWKLPLLDKAAARLLSDAQFADLRKEMDAFRSENAWVEQSALFSVLTEQPDLVGEAWWDWPAAVRDRDPDTLAKVRTEHAGRINTFIALQFLFDRFWKQLKTYANSKGVGLVGDMPIYVGGQSADVWANRDLFELQPDGTPALVSGVPPDAFSATGQLWGSPLYDWQAHAKEGFAWWRQRMARHMQLYDETRIDHFRAFAGYWAVAADAETAMVGTWKKGPGVELFQALEDDLGSVPILAEDLGVITSDVIALRKAIDAPGMVVLQFAWGGGSTNTHLPHNIYENCFVYPGTHDNQTAAGWWKKGARVEERALIRRYTGMTDDDVAYCFIREAFKSCAQTAVVTMQDIMRLDDTARMNVPGRAAGNWAWRVGESDVWEQLREEQAQLRQWVDEYDRLPPGGVAPPPRAAGRTGSTSFR
ncbi:4-alpha-glucanotransferase chloroplastic amyloplastic [Micractinium conductrix]|uniref:4-alpha-glucanotransferase n=1 Tax=Micractinium conductrix TaxID=554055 RepID=A0A2P6VG02_9CHLO|nr:4-alpha-glucanotransferase chloroplastic amyloplastic [Micractinium conductrix]|eukprot:PSC73026.1 4-alpha-glucanotransferase chloroplastic amyloplastic [Micractinium conductrix]